ncbi:GTPase activating protein [Vararia minispora EC-137]|uniref:GTPase activating protein n=1 Tax=Vararia minispora EC-137 TaxID=1314806 RepID=A0ACB8Q9G5_9AGAM|nr:GTPase activating protein [Vararia minispora EC-137]
MSIAHGHTPHPHYLDDARSADGHTGTGTDSTRSLSHSPTTSLSYGSASVPPFSVPSRPSLSSADSEPQPHHNPPIASAHAHYAGAFGKRGAVEDEGNVVEPSFDENVLRALCELDCGVPLLLDRIKQGLASCREAATFFKRRAALEEEYGRNLQKMSKTTTEAYALSDGKAGTYVGAWQTTMKIHDIIAENRIRFGQRLKEMADDLTTLSNEVEKNRKLSKDLASRYERTLLDSEITTEKSKARFDQTAEELERLLLQKEGENVKESAALQRPSAGGKRVIGKAVAKGGLLLKGKSAASIQRQEDDVRARMSASSDAYRKAVIDTQAIRQEYFNFQLPRILRALKECADEIDLGTQYHLTRYAFLFESSLLGDGATVAPTGGIEDGPGLKSTIESIDNRKDFNVYMQNYAYAHGGVQRGPRRTGPEHEGFLPPQPQHHLSPRSNGSAPAPALAPAPERTGSGNTNTFGVNLAEQVAREGTDVPGIVVKLAGAIEKHGITSVGIYRVNGTMSKVGRLREMLNRDPEGVNLDAEEWAGDINNVASVMKQWFRELPEPLLTHTLHTGFLDAANIENDRLRHIRLHERVNELPDPNYATLKYFMGHLNKIAQYQSENQMSVSNLAIVFGPTLFSQSQGTQVDPMLQNKAIETILEHYTDIFVDESEHA